eukprot:UN03391
MEDCDGSTCTQVGTTFANSLADCQQLCRENSACNFITYTESNEGDCDFYDACPSSKISDCCEDAVTTQVCGSDSPSVVVISDSSDSSEEESSMEESSMESESYTYVMRR